MRGAVVSRAHPPPSAAADEQLRGIWPRPRFVSWAAKGARRASDAPELVGNGTGRAGSVVQPARATSQERRGPLSPVFRYAAVSLSPSSGGSSSEGSSSVTTAPAE